VKLISFSLKPIKITSSFLVFYIGHEIQSSIVTTGEGFFLFFFWCVEGDSKRGLSTHA
jgi:hypothetical protein